MKKLPQIFSIVVSLSIMAATPSLSFAQTTSTSSTPATNISNEYSYFLKNVNSQQVVNDLRNGQWTTTTIDPQTNTTTTTTIGPRKALTTVESWDIATNSRACSSSLRPALAPTACKTGHPSVSKPADSLAWTSCTRKL